MFLAVNVCGLFERCGDVEGVGQRCGDVEGGAEVW